MADTNQSNNQQGSNSRLSRREVIKQLASVPVVGAFAYGVYKKQQYKKFLKKNILQETQMKEGESEIDTMPENNKDKLLRLGIIGYGIRGHQLMKAAGFAPPETIKEWKKNARKNPDDTTYEDFMKQEDLNIEINGVCDLFDIRAEEARKAGANKNREESSEKLNQLPRRYKNYKDLLAADDIDAVIIATPDHWHAQITIDAAEAGKHVYLEKAMTRKIAEVPEVVNAVKRNNIIFQLGHQGRQTKSYIKAREAIHKNVLGDITLIEVTTNRNSPNGAWVYDIHPKAGPHNIDWQQFIKPTKKHPFSLERFFRWRCWWDYGTGLSGDLLSHEYDAMNQVLDLGIPESAVASGGVYYYKDGREVPDVFQVTYEYPERNLSLLYSATLASNKDRGRTIMGHDAYMELGNALNVYADPRSTKYKDKIDRGIIDPDLPIYQYIPGKEQTDAVTSATEQYFAGRGLLYTYRNGRRVDTTHLHVKEWLQGIRNNKQPSCDINKGYEEAITIQMATIAYREGRKVYWDKNKQTIV